MDNEKPIWPQDRFRWKKLFQYFLQGVLIIGPLAITAYTIYWIVSTVDSWVPIFREPIYDLNHQVIDYRVKNYGLGFVIILAVVIDYYRRRLARRLG